MWEEKAGGEHLSGVIPYDSDSEFRPRWLDWVVKDPDFPQFVPLYCASFILPFPNHPSPHFPQHLSVNSYHRHRCQITSFVLQSKCSWKEQHLGGVILEEPTVLSLFCRVCWDSCPEATAPALSSPLPFTLHSAAVTVSSGSFSPAQRVRVVWGESQALSLNLCTC